MRVHAQLMMVISLDKCIGCHACSVACKQSWTERAGSEHIWFNNVETRPGRGYPGRWEDRARWGGGWEQDGGGRLRLRAEMRRQDLRRLFRDRSQSVIDDYYEPWANEPSELVDAPLAERPPTAGPRSMVTGRPLAAKGGPNWDDQLAGMDVEEDPNLSEEQARQVRHLEKVFMLYLPRICNHCLNPSCAAVCPSRAIYKRVSDGVVLVDEERCRKQGLCEQGCPYRKVYINRLSGKAEKCMFCLPGVTEDGLPTLCSESCVGRVRSVGVVLYDPESVVATASVSDDSLVEAQREALLDPGDESVISAAERSGVPTAWVEAARRSPVYALAKELRVALPLHPEFRTLPMVWYVPPLSPLLDPLEAIGYDPADPEQVFPAVDKMRIPVDYLASMLSAGARAPVEEALARMVAMRGLKRHQQIHPDGGAQFAGKAGFDVEELERLFRLLGIADANSRYVIPTAHYEPSSGENAVGRARRRERTER